MRYIGASTYRSTSQEGQYRHYRKSVTNSGQILFTTREQTLFLKLSDTVVRGGQGKLPLLLVSSADPTVGGERHHAWLSSILSTKTEIAAVLAVTKLSQFSVSLDVKNKIQEDTSQYVGLSSLVAPSTSSTSCCYYPVLMVSQLWCWLAKQKFHAISNESKQSTW